MTAYIIKRLLWAVPTFIGAMTLIFLVMRVLPGDVALMMLGGEGQNVDPVQLNQLRETLGLNRPLWEQYGYFMWDLFRGDMGKSLWTGQPVWTEITTRLPYTLSLVVLTFCVSISIALPFGITAAIKQDSWIDYLLRTISIAGLSIPNFYLGLMILMVLVTYFKWFPPLEYAPVWQNPGVAIQQLFLPALVLGFRQSCTTMRMTRSSMLEVMREDYVRTSRAMGVRERTVIASHALRNAILPVVTIWGMETIMMIGGTVIIETIFNIPGVGRLMVDSINHRDVNLVQGVTAFICIVVLLVNLMVDLAYAWIDPRIRYK